MARPSLSDPRYYFNRHESWLAFNRRVLEEALDEGNPLLESAEIQDCFPQSFAGDGSGVNTNAADRLFSIDDGHFLAHLGGADGALLSRRTAADHHQIVLVSFHERGKLPLDDLKQKLNSAS